MRAPDTKKPGKRRLPRVYMSGALKVPEVMGSPRVLLSGSLSATSERQLREALKILNPPSTERESWRKKIHQVLAFREMHWSPNVESDERRLRRRPPNTRAREAVDLARLVLETCDLKLTTGPKGKWHVLAQTYANSSSDRHHLRNSLRDFPLAEKS